MNVQQSIAHSDTLVTSGSEPAPACLSAAAYAETAATTVDIQLQEKTPLARCESAMQRWTATRTPSSRLKAARTSEQAGSVAGKPAMKMPISTFMDMHHTQTTGKAHWNWRSGSVSVGRLSSACSVRACSRYTARLTPKLGVSAPHAHAISVLDSERAATSARPMAARSPPSPCRRRPCCSPRRDVSVAVVRTVVESAGAIRGRRGHTTEACC